jgi:hypothetical protein
MKIKIKIPIYDALLWLIVVDDIYAERKKMEDIFGPTPTSNFGALCSYGDFSSHFGLFFKKDTVDISDISHEVFHLTHRILEWTNCPFDIDHQEQGALLNSYLMKLVIGKIFKSPTQIRV